MQLVDIYVQNIGQHLPLKTREDIQNEIRSLIEDALEDESRLQGRASDDEMIVTVLKRMGSPERVAASYQPPRYLIGPQLYPQFITVLRIVLTVIVVVGVIGLGIALGNAANLPENVAQALGRGALDLLNSLFYATGMLAVIFALIERLNPDLKIAPKDWDPRDLHAEPDPERVQPAGSVFQIIFNVLAIVALTQYSEWLGISTLHGGEWIHVPVLSAAFFQYVPWMCLLWALEAARHALLLAQGRSTALTRWSAVAWSIFAIVLSGSMLLGPSLVHIDPVAFARLGWGAVEPGTLQTASTGLAAAVRIGIGIGLAAQVIELGKHLYKLVLRQRLPAALG